MGTSCPLQQTLLLTLSTFEVLGDVSEVGYGELVELDQPLMITPTLVAQLLHLKHQRPFEVLRPHTVLTTTTTMTKQRLKQKVYFS